jgi:hypothetical protein
MKLEMMKKLLHKKLAQIEKEINQIKRSENIDKVG